MERQAVPDLYWLKTLYVPSIAQVPRGRGVSFERILRPRPAGGGRVQDATSFEVHGRLLLCLKARAILKMKSNLIEWVQSEMNEH